jgi:futalosine hydrolase
MTRILIVTAASTERDAVLLGRQAAIGMVEGIEVHRIVAGAGMVDVISGGIGPVAATVAAGCVLRHGYDLAICAGIAGGFPSVEVGSTVVADTVAHADLGADSEQGFTSMADLGWGPVRFGLDSQLTYQVANRTGAKVGTVLTVSTVTGTRHRATALFDAYPDAVAEGMEGIGVYRAATKLGVPFAELRTISNPVGPRRRDEWRLTEALSALTLACEQLISEPFPLPAVEASA